MRILAVAAVFLALTGAAFAQAGNTIIDPEMLPQNRAIDQQYRNALKRLPDSQGANDPWSKMRSVEQDSGNKQASGKKSRAN